MTKQTRSIRSFRLLLLTVGSLLLAVPAAGAPIYFASASGGVDVIGVTGAFQDADFLQLTSVDTLGPIDASVAAVGHTAYGWGSVVDGTLLAFASVTDPSLDEWSAHAVGSAFFLDTLTIQSSSLALGTPVQVQFEVQLSSATTPCSFDNSAVALVSLQTSISGQAVVQNSSCDINDVFNPMFVLQTTVGAEFQVFAFLQALASSGLGFAQADAGSTAMFFVTPLGDFFYTTASGNTYSLPTTAAVPEPATLLLVASGLAATAGARSGRRRSRRR